jgi:diketogulonate reductase-like aldo/keto reductase
MPCQAASGIRLPTRPIPGTGEPLPIIGLGNSEAFQSGNVPLSRQILDIFMEKGGAYVDTSGPGRYTVGEIVRERNAQDDMFLGTYISSTDTEAGLAEIMAVREAQDVSSLDLVLTRNVKDMAANPDKFRGWKEDGLTRYLGVARPNKSFYEIMMEFMASGVVDFVQVNYSMLETEAAETLLPMAQDKGIAVVINRPFLNGQYFSIVKNQALPEWAAEFDCDSWAQFSLKFILANPAVNCVLTETANPKHVVDNLNAGFGRLPDEKTRQRMVELMHDLANRQ